MSPEEQKLLDEAVGPATAEAPARDEVDMPERVFPGSSGVVGASVTGIGGMVATLVGGLALMERLSLPPWTFLVLLVLSVAVVILVVKSIGTDATFEIEAEALVRTKRGATRRFPWSQVLYASHERSHPLTPGGRITILLRSGASIAIDVRTRDQAAELEEFFLAMKAHLPGDRRA